jgi:hypothetical protein
MKIGFSQGDSTERQNRQKPGVNERRSTTELTARSHKVLVAGVSPANFQSYIS